MSSNDEEAGQNATPPDGVATTGPTKATGPVHVPALDGIRGLALLLILFDHFFQANSHTGNRIFDFFSGVRDSSYVGVNLFFALSGFLITGILLDTRALPNFFQAFYARRALRICPLYYGVLLLALLLTRPLHIVWNGWQYFYLTYTANLVLTARPAWITPHLNLNHFWSLQVEEQFYLVWPFVVYRLRKPGTLAGLSLAFCGVVLLLRIGLVAARPWPNNPYILYSPTFSCADNLLYGCCLAALLRTSFRDHVLRLAPPVFGLAASVLLGVAIYHGGLQFNDSDFIPTLGFSLIGIASTALIASALRTGAWAQLFFSNSILRFFGKYSYGLYVFHYSVAATLNPVMRNFFDSRLQNKWSGVFAGAFLDLVVSIAIALFSYHLYEVHFLKLKRYFTYRSDAPPQRQGVVAVY